MQKKLSNMKNFILLLLVSHLLLMACSGCKYAKTYTVAEFYDLYQKDKQFLKGQTVVIEGFYQSSGVISGPSPYNPLIFYLFANEKYYNSDGSIFFEAKEGQLITGGRQKLKVFGRVSDRPHGKYPFITDAEILE